MAWLIYTRRWVSYLLNHLFCWDDKVFNANVMSTFANFSDFFCPHQDISCKYSSGHNRWKRSTRVTALYIGIKQIYHPFKQVCCEIDVDGNYSSMFFSVFELVKDSFSFGQILFRESFFWAYRQSEVIGVRWSKMKNIDERIFFFFLTIIY
jgi:hypothetical protein